MRNSKANHGLHPLGRQNLHLPQVAQIPLIGRPQRKAYVNHELPLAARRAQISVRARPPPRRFRIRPIRRRSVVRRRLTPRRLPTSLSSPALALPMRSAPRTFPPRRVVVIKGLEAPRHPQRARRTPPMDFLVRQHPLSQTSKKTPARH